MKEYRYVYEEGKLPAAFRALPFLAAFEPKHLRDILSLSRIREYRAGETIVAEGKAEGWMYILLSGRAEVVKRGEALAALDRPGDIFGELALVDGEARSASVVARRRSVCLVVDRDSLERMPPDARNACYAAIYRLFVNIVAKRLRATNERLVRAEAELEEWRTRGGRGPAKRGETAP
jgi:CRP-like cAMP-binding protein